MKSTHLPGRRTFLRLLGLVFAAPVMAKPKAAATMATADGPDWLDEWRELPRIPVTSSDDPLTSLLITSAEDGIFVGIYYHGGSQPHRLRIFYPELVFRHEHGRHTYVSGYCYLRQAPRILRVDRVEYA